jgi:hypothetical protein
MVKLEVLAPLLAMASTMASAQQYPPPVWADILNLQGQSTAASGNYYRTGQAVVRNTDLAGITPLANTLTMPVTYLTGMGGGPVNCGNSTEYPLSFIESNAERGIKGVGFLGSFNSPYPLTELTDANGNPATLYQAVFYGDNPCYGGGREYGFFLDAYNNSIWVYWGAAENEGLPGAQGQLQIPDVYANTQYYFEMYPVAVADAPGGCKLQETVYLSNGWVWEALSQNVTDFGGINILTYDPHFCDYLLQNYPYQEDGYVSANITPGQPLSGSLPESGLDLSIQRVFVGGDGRDDGRLRPRSP